MIIDRGIKQKLEVELLEAKSIWIASAMISNNGWNFIQKNISKDTEQHFLIGIDLATDPKVFDTLLDNLNINARVYQTKFTFHPKVYLIQKMDNSFTAFIGSSNTTNWGLEKNVEMNFQINDQAECKKLLNWFNTLYINGYIITQDFANDYKSKFIKTSFQKKAIQKDIDNISIELSKDEGQFFSRNHHQIFEERYHRVNSEDLKRIRKEVSNKFKELHRIIYPQFKINLLSNLNCHPNSREIVIRHFFNQNSGNYINAMWLHYGKSHQELEELKNNDKSINRPHSFINNIRIQVILHVKSMGIWLVLGKNGGSLKDREHLKSSLNNKAKLNIFFRKADKIKEEYWIDNGVESVKIKDFVDAENLKKFVQQSNTNDYFIIGREIDLLDEKLSTKNISKTVITEFKKLYPLYELMKAKL